MAGPKAGNFSKLADSKKEKLLAAAGAKPEVIKMILEMDKKASEIIKKDPGMAKAWGAGCGGVTC